MFLPKESESSKVPVLYYLAGLTCTEDTAYVFFLSTHHVRVEAARSRWLYRPWKAGFLRDAAAEGIAMVFPGSSCSLCVPNLTQHR